MSHATVLVISKSPEEVETLLAPYYEELHVEQVTETYEGETETYWRNPKAKWDWWVVGGRWSGNLVADGAPCDQAQKRDIDFEAMRLQQSEGAGEYWDSLQGEGAFLGFGGDKIAAMDREEFQRSRERFSAFAVLTPDGEWHEKGSMGWWATVSDEKDEQVWQDEFDRLVSEASDTHWFTIVDFHI